MSSFISTHSNVRGQTVALTIIVSLEQMSACKFCQRAVYFNGAFFLSFREINKNVAKSEIRNYKLIHHFISMWTHIPMKCKKSTAFSFGLSFLYNFLVTFMTIIMDHNYKFKTRFDCNGSMLDSFYETQLKIQTKQTATAAKECIPMWIFFNTF